MQQTTPTTTLVLALALLLFAGAVTFGWRTWYQRKLTGSAGWRFGGLRPLSLEWNAGVLFLVAVILVAAAPVVALAGVVEPLVAPAALGAAALGVAGLVCMATATALVVWAQLAMGRSWRIGVDANERTELVVRGPFRLVRNPIFSALWLLTFGLAMAVPNVVAVAAVVVLTAALELQVRAVEEPYLVRTHGSAYRAYASTVGRFVPRLGRLTSLETTTG